MGFPEAPLPFDLLLAKSDDKVIIWRTVTFPPQWVGTEIRWELSGGDGTSTVAFLHGTFADETEEGDIDGNVNPFQSQEVYNFGRRLGKNIVYLMYEDENHNVARPESQADYTKRQLEWFGHYLKGEPAASWITEGETYATRQKILRAPAATGAVQAGTPTGRPR